LPRPWRSEAQIALLALVVGVTTLVAQLVGAANLRAGMGFSQIAFAIVLLYLIVRRGHRGRAVPTPRLPAFDRDRHESYSAGAGMPDSPSTVSSRDNAQGIGRDAQRAPSSRR
jgi:hypothetical protein